MRISEVVKELSLLDGLKVPMFGKDFFVWAGQFRDMRPAAATANRELFGVRSCRSQEDNRRDECRFHSGSLQRLLDPLA